MRRITIFVLTIFVVHSGLNVAAQQEYLSQEQLSSIQELVNEAIKDELPVDYINQRIKEAKAKKVEYIILYTVLLEKITKLKIAKELLNEFYEIPSKDKAYTIQLLSELLEKGLSIHEFVHIAKQSVKLKINYKDSLRYARLLVYGKEIKLDTKETIEIVLEAMKEKRSYLETKSELQKFKSQEIREEILKEQLEKKHIER